MTRRDPVDDVLGAWLEEGPTWAPADLLSAGQSIPLHHRQRRSLAHAGSAILGRGLRPAATAAAVIVLTFGGIVLAHGLDPAGRVGTAGGGTPTAIPSRPAGSQLAAAPSPTPLPTQPSPPTDATAGPCRASDLVAAVASWDGAAGNRIATVTLTNTGSGPCRTPAVDEPQLVGPSGTILIDGGAAAASTALTVEPGRTLTTLVDAANYCGPDVGTGAVTLAFVLADGSGRVVAAPAGANDQAGLPPCNGNPGSAGAIQMQPWAPAG